MSHKKSSCIFPILVLFSLLQRMGQSKTPQSRKVCSVEKHNCCLRNVKVSSRNNIFCSVLAFPPTLTQAKRSLLCTAREWETSTGLLLAQLGFLFVLDTWWHSPCQIQGPKSNLFSFKNRKGSAFLPAHTLGKAALLTKQLSVLVLQLRYRRSHGSHSNLRRVYKHKRSNLLLSSQLYCQFGNYNTQFSALLGPIRATWTQRSAHTAQLARPVPQFVMLI